MCNIPRNGYGEHFDNPMDLEVHYFQTNPYVNIYEHSFSFGCHLQSTYNVTLDYEPYVYDYIHVYIYIYIFPYTYIHSWTILYLALPFCFAQLDSAFAAAEIRCCRRSSGRGGPCGVSGALQFAPASRSATQSTRLSHQVLPVPWWSRGGPVVWLDHEG